MVGSNNPTISATSRERELYRYYQPNENENTDGVEERKASSDPCLTAFAQLGALRLNAKRGIITLSSDAAEFLLAESGQSLSLQRDNDARDLLWHGIGRLRDHGDGEVPLGTELAKYFCKTNEEYLVVNDLTKHDRFMNKHIVKYEPHVRFVAAVPLRASQSSAVIGNYIIADEKVRDGLNESEIQFLVDMGVTVMDYLEAGLIKRKQYRSDKMIKAIGLFIEGKSSLRNWWLQTGYKLSRPVTQQRAKSFAPLGQLADAEFGVQEPISSLKSLGLSKEDTLNPTPSISSAPSRFDFGDGRPPLPHKLSQITSSDTNSHSTLLSKSYKDRNSSVTTFDTLVELNADHHENRNSVPFDLPTPHLTDDVSKELQDALLSTELKDVFSRASNLIREAIAVEGVLFLDASIGSFGASSDRNAEEKAPGAFQVDHQPTSSEDEMGRKQSVDSQVDSSQHERPIEKCCNILGYSTRRRSSLRGHRPAAEYGRLPEAMLRRLLKRYPHGKVFNFDQEGVFSSSDSDSIPRKEPSGGTLPHTTPQHERSYRKHHSKEAEAKAILDVLPEARSVFWFPLWDQSRERWFSGTLVWSTTLTRIMCPMEDLTYLAAFGNSTMAEVSRISAQVLVKMKSDFISSVSHELRSPLHGVLASVEFLQETAMTEVQEDMVNNIHSSGKVLLDTINHVLDFSKVNRKSKNNLNVSNAGRRKIKQSQDRSHTDEERDEITDVLILSEEVIESIYAGQSIGKSPSPSSQRSSFMAPKEHPVVIITDIKWQENWTFEIDPGAWSRILMNLFSNAMKYTKVGFVRVSLEVEHEEVPWNRKVGSTLVLKVRDSGKGISSEFLKHRLFKPFTQEDSLVTGTGLGLSIVRHIIQDLGGQIGFTSEQGTGTEATVRLPMTVRKPRASMGVSDIISQTRKATKGLRFRLEGFDRYPDIMETPTGILSSETEAAILLRSSTESLLIDWFGMEPSSASESKAGADVTVIMESGIGWRGIQETFKSYDNKSSSKSGKSIAIILGSGYHPGPKMHTCGDFQIHYWHQPYGPHKAVKILHSAFCEDNSHSAESVQPNYEPPEAPPDFSTSTNPGLANGKNGTILGTAHTKNVDLVASLISSAKSLDLSKEAIHLPNDTKENGTAEAKELRVLLVEDNEINLKLLVATMRKLKITHATATNGLEALNTYKSTRGQFDVVFMDISMPIMSGIDSARHIRRFEKEEGLQPTKLIALTGAANPTTRQEAFSVGVDLYLTKPVPMKELRGMLEEVKKEGEVVC